VQAAARIGCLDRARLEGLAAHDPDPDLRQRLDEILHAQRGESP